MFVTRPIVIYWLVLWGFSWALVGGIAWILCTVFMWLLVLGSAPAHAQDLPHGASYCNGCRAPNYQQAPRVPP